MSKLDIYTPLIKTALDRAKQNGVYAILRLQDYKKIRMKVEDGKTENKIVEPIKGIGISVFTPDGATAFESTSRLDEKHVIQAIDRAAGLAKNSEKYEGVKRNKEIFYVDGLQGVFLQETKHNINSKTSSEIEEIVKGFNKEAKDLGDEFSVTTSYAVVDDEWRVARSDGTDVIFNMPYSSLSSEFTLKEGEKISQAHFSIPGVDLGVILNDDSKHIFGKRARRIAALVSALLNAPTLPGGNYKSVHSFDFIGLYVHEAVGHGFEADLMKNSIVGTEEGLLRIGEEIAPNHISFYDGPVAGGFGNQFVSANGVLRNTVEFLKNGKINDALSDVFSAKEVGVGINGCGRAETYANLPICRMAVSWLEDKNPYPFNKTSMDDVTLDDIDEVLEKNGELKPGEKIVQPVVGMGGQVDTVKGTFVFGGAAVYMFENPKKTTLYKQSNFSGITRETLATGTRGIGPVVKGHPGMCGKGQAAPVSCGGNILVVIDKSDSIVFGGEQ